VEALTERRLRRAFVNCSRGEAEGLTLPAGFASLAWEQVDLLGWRDARAALRGYLVVERDGEPVGIALRAPSSSMSSRTPASCLLCETAQSGDAVALFTARRAGQAGRDGNTVGTYMCADLGCSGRARTEIPPWLRDRDPAVVAEERAAALQVRAQGFLDAVLRTA
jgi:hypothetical protein